MFLGEVWDQILPPDDQHDLLVDAIFEALQIESGSHEIVWTKRELRNLVTVDVNEIDLKNLDNNHLSEQLENAFTDVAFVPEHTLNKFDFEQITNNVIKIAFAKFEQKLRAPENQNLRIYLIEKYARNSGMKVNQIEKDFEISLAKTAKELHSFEIKLDEAVIRTNQIEGNMSNLMDSIERIDNTLELIRQTMIILQYPASNENSFVGEVNISDSNRRTKLIQLQHYEFSLQAYKISWSTYAAQQNIPVQDFREVMYITSKVEEIRRDIGIT